jgi:hypothetical protein
MTIKNNAIRDILDIAHQYNISVAEITNAFKMVADKEPETSSSMLGKILGYLGGVFIFAGLSIFITMNWDVMNTAARIIITLGSGLAVFVMALVASADDRYSKLKTPLYLISAALQPTGILVAIDEFSTVGDWHYAVMVTAGIMALQQAAVFWKKRDTTLLFTSLLFTLWFFGVTLDLLQVDDEMIALVLGAATLIFCVGLERTPFNGMNSFWYLVGSVMFYYGLFELVENSAVELIFLALACSGIFLSTWVRSRTLLFTSNVAILAYISYFSYEHFQHSLGWPLVLIMMGIIFIALSVLAMRINSRYISSPDS